MTIQKIEQFFMALFLMTLGIVSSKGLFSFPMEPFKAIGIVFILLFLLSMNNNAKVLSVLPKYFLYFLIYIYLLTFISFLISFQFSSEINTNISQRYFTQFVSYTAQIAIGFYLFKYILKDFKFIKKYLFYGFHIVIFFAFVQMIGIYTNVFQWGAIDFGSGFAVNRISSISGEPKMFAAYILPFIIYRIYTRFKDEKLLSAFSLFAYIKAFSTSSYIVLLFSLILIYIKKASSIVKIAFILGILSTSLLNDYIYDRSIGRIVMLFTPDAYIDPNKTMVHFPIIDQTLLVDGTEAPSYELVFHHPYVMLTGIGYGMESVYSYLYFTKYTSGWHELDYTGTLSPNNSLLRNSLYFGLPLTLFIFVILIKIGRKSLKCENNDIQFFGIFIIVLTVSNILIFGSFLNVIPLIFIALAINRLLKYNIRDTK